MTYDLFECVISNIYAPNDVDNRALEGLNILLKRAKEIGLLKGASIEPSKLKLSRLQFADNNIIFYEDVKEEIIVIKRILKCFEVISGLKINFHKSVVCGVEVSDEKAKEFASILNCSSQKLPLKYLGFPLGASLRSRRTWKPVVDKIRFTLASWKRKLLSFAGSLTLIRLVLSN
ncbi:uncharacterized protein LOC114283300 [Camellia sinensis]|uniref:uncharacterized protein LOC114283300 n=1 Tax=Camellia sinensis TaxID=4442 RepID=UPI00103560DE|nr:uncharacterized protein LOC114283300 [Camellia sinensis]